MTEKVPNKKDVITVLRGCVRREKDPTRKELYSGLVELIQNYDTVPAEHRPTMVKLIRSAIDKLAINGEERPEKPYHAMNYTKSAKPV